MNSRRERNTKPVDIVRTSRVLRDTCGPRNIYAPPPKPEDAISWGTVDPKTGLLACFTDNGLWCVIDTRDLAQCYFIGGDEGPVKIGYSGDAGLRLKQLQLGSPVRLKILAVTHGGRTMESDYHFRFGRHHLWGEWFERVPAIQREIDRLNEICPWRPGIDKEGRFLPA